jgi:hypothetical protein
VLVGTTPVVWSSKKQSCIALSSHESEYVAGGVTATKLLVVSNVMKLLTDLKSTPTMFMDNQSAIHSIIESSCPPKAKHISVKYHFIRKLVSDEVIAVKFVKGVHNIADVFTKPLTGPKYKNIADSLVGQ